MPILWPHQYVIRPTKLLLSELEGLDRSHGGVDQPQVWVQPTAGDHDYEGQQADGLTFMKLSG